MEIKLGEYIRTKEGYIAKLENIYFCKYINETIYECDSTVYTDHGDPTRDFNGEDELELFIVKHSFNIIDLIEVGDYVNGEKVIGKGALSCEPQYYNKNSYDIEYFDDIKSIVTKEQFESIEYKVGD